MGKCFRVSPEHRNGPKNPIEQDTIQVVERLDDEIRVPVALSTHAKFNDFEIAYGIQLVLPDLVSQNIFDVGW